MKCNSICQNLFDCHFNVENNRKHIIFFNILSKNVIQNQTHHYLIMARPRNRLSLSFLYQASFFPYLSEHKIDLGALSCSNATVASFFYIFPKINFHNFCTNIVNLNRHFALVLYILLACSPIFNDSTSF